MKSLPSHPLRLGAGQEANNSSNIVRVPRSVEWTHCSNLRINGFFTHRFASGDVVFSSLGPHVSLHTTGRNTVHGDIARAKVAGQTLDHPRDGCLGHGIDCMARNTLPEFGKQKSDTV